MYIRNVFPDNMSTDKRIDKTQISKLIQSGGSSDFSLDNIGKKGLTSIAILLAK